MRPLSLENIRMAQRIIASEFQQTPLIHATSLDNEIEAKLEFKIETLNPIRSFKGRGADYYLGTRLHKGPLVCASAGNFGQGLAYSGRKRGHKVTVFASKNANPLKIKSMRNFGADVILAGSDFDAAKFEAKKYAKENDWAFVEDGAVPEIAEGAGTIALEMINQSQCQIDAVFIPLGNGALAGGVATVFKALSPDTKIICVTAAGAPSMKLSLENDKKISTNKANTIADGIAVREPVEYALSTLRGMIDEVVSVDEMEISNCILQCLTRLGLVIEPAGIVGLAAIMKAKEEWKGSHIATILCGSNIDSNLLSQIL